MITRNALYDFIQSLIDNSAGTDALYEAEIFPNVRSSVDEANKVVRIEIVTGEHNVSQEDVRKEMGVDTTIQCWVIPDNQSNLDEMLAMDEATDLSFEMSKQIFYAISADPDLGGRVCVADFRMFETDEASMGTIKRGVTYLDGVVNPLGEQ